MSTASVATHYGVHALAEIAATVAPDAEASYYHKIDSVSLLILLSKFLRNIQYDLEIIRALINPSAKNDIDLMYVRFITIILDHDEIWKEVRPEVRDALKASLKLPEIKPSESKKDCRKALKSIREHWIQENGKARRRNEKLRRRDQKNMVASE